MTGEEHVSVIIPTYYRNERLAEAIESVLRQDYPTRILVVDDSGENHAESVASKYPEIKYIALERNRGQNTALNKGLQEASGKYIQFLDDDDILLEGKLREQIDILEDNSETGVVYCGKKYVSGEESLPSEDERGEVLKRCLTFSLNCCVTSTMLIRKRLIDSLGPLPTPPGSTDTHMKILFASQTKFDFVNKALVLKREDTANSVSASWNAVKGTWLAIDWHKEIYEEFEKDVLNTARSAAAWRAGKYLLENNRWSVRGVYYYWYSFWRDPNPTIGKYAMILLSLFGRPGKHILENIDEMLTDQD